MQLFGDFFNALNCNTCEPYAILGGINSTSYATSSSIDSQKDYSLKSNESPISGERGAENIGLAVFKKDKLVGELNALETISFLCLKNKIEGFLVSIPNPQEENTYLDVYLTPSRSSKISVSLVNGSPLVKINAEFSGRIRSFSKDSKYLDQQILDAISSSCNHYLESNFSNYLYKTSVDLKSDITGIGKFAMKQFLTDDEFSNYNWTEHFPNTSFEVTIQTKINSGSLLIQT